MRITWTRTSYEQWMASFRPPAQPLNWAALAGFPDLLVRRNSDRDEWLVAARSGGGPISRRPGNNGAWVGHLAFDLQDAWDRVPSRFPNGPLPGSAWWEPELLLVLRSGQPHVLVDKATRSAGEVGGDLLSRPGARTSGTDPVSWNPRTTKAQYLATVEKLLGHLQRGDIYEVNYCTERTATLRGSDPFDVFGRLVEHTNAPYAAFYRSGDFFALCMSPEHFLRIENRRVSTRPMKGTRPRSNDPAVDARLKYELATDVKERSENIMAVDVARHDLSRIAASGSVRVDELCAVKSYPNVHQLVSTVSAELREGADPWDAVRAAFPMASMTGAPKRSALRLIDAVEDMPRGLFSGSLGYQLPDGTLDLNVVIRTITYDASTGRASLITGSAITALSDPEKEWEECELKAMSVLQALGHAG